MLPIWVQSGVERCPARWDARSEDRDRHCDLAEHEVQLVAVPQNARSTDSLSPGTEREWIRTFSSAMRLRRRQRGGGVTRLIRTVRGGSSNRRRQLDRCARRRQLLG